MLAVIPSTKRSESRASQSQKQSLLGDQHIEQDRTTKILKIITILKEFGFTGPAHSGTTRMYSTCGECQARLGGGEFAIPWMHGLHDYSPDHFHFEV